MTVNFSLLALDQIVNNAATLLHMSGGQFNVPLVIRMTTGAGRQLAAQHSHSLEGWYAHIPGIKVLAPGDGRGRARHAAGRRSRTPTRCCIFEHGGALQHRGRAAPTTPGPVDIDRAAVRRPGTDVTLDHLRRHAAEVRSRRPTSWRREGIDAEVVDLRVAAAARRRHASLDSVRAHAPRRRRRRGLAQRQPRRPRSARGSWRARSTSSTRRSRGSARAEVPMPYAKHLEEAALPAGRPASSTAVARRSVTDG